VFPSLARGGEEEEEERGGGVTPALADVSSLLCACVLLLVPLPVPLPVPVPVPAPVPVPVAVAVALPAAELVVDEAELTVADKWRRGRLFDSSIGRERDIRIAHTVR
jgi:hypothetical protein